MTVTNVCVGATTPAGATVVGKVSGSSVRLAVADNAGLAGAAFFGPVAPTAQGIVRINASGLSSGQRYHFGLEVDGQLDTAFRGQFRTHPPVGAPASFTVGMATCAGSGSDYPGVGNVLASNRLSNHPVFDTIRQQALAEDWLLFIHGGDRHYYDIGSGRYVPNHDLATFRRSYDDVFLQPRQHALYRNVPTVYMYDDHDFGPNNSDRTSPGRNNAVQVYRERVPHYPLGSTDQTAPTYHSFEIGRVLFVVWDVRADRDPNNTPAGPNKTMLGARQKAWFESVLATSPVRFLVVVLPSQWDRQSSSDTFGNFTHERAQLTNMLNVPGGDASKNWLPRMCILQGDKHSIEMSTTNPWGGFPVFQYAPLDSGPSAEQRWRDIGSSSSRGQYGTLSFADTGDAITVTAVGYANGSARVRWSFVVPDTVAVPPTKQAAPNALYTATNTTFGTATTSGDYYPCGTVFVAPPSGRVLIHWSGGLRNLATGPSPSARLSPQVRTGPVVGSGTVVMAAADSRTVRSNYTDAQSPRASATHLLSGLTPGATYNVQLLHRVSSNTGEFFQRNVIVEPSP